MIIEEIGGILSLIPIHTTWHSCITIAATASYAVILIIRDADSLVTTKVAVSLTIALLQSKLNSLLLKISVVVGCSGNGFIQRSFSLDQF